MHMVKTNKTTEQFERQRNVSFPLFISNPSGPFPEVTTISHFYCVLHMFKAYYINISLKNVDIPC